MKYTILVHRSNYPAEVIKLSAANKEEATKKAKALNYKVLAVHPEKRSIYFSFQKKFSLDVFTERFLSLQKAGLNVTQSIEILGKRETAEKNVYENIINIYERGHHYPMRLPQYLMSFRLCISLRSNHRNAPAILWKRWNAISNTVGKRR